MSSVYDDITARLDAEQQAITDEATAAQSARVTAITQADVEHQTAIKRAEDTFQAAMVPLSARAGEVEAIRKSLTALHAVPVDPQTPSAPAGDATTSASDEQPAQPSEQPSEPSTPPDAPSTPSDEPAPTPSTESGAVSSDPAPTASPEPIEVTNLGGAENVDLSLPVAVPQTTGQIKVVTAGDVIAAQDDTIEDEALTTTQLDLRRNSDWP